MFTSNLSWRILQYLVPYPLEEICRKQFLWHSIITPKAWFFVKYTILEQQQLLLQYVSSSNKWQDLSSILRKCWMWNTVVHLLLFGWLIFATEVISCKVCLSLRKAINTASLAVLVGFWVKWQRARDGLHETLHINVQITKERVFYFWHSWEEKKWTTGRDKSGDWTCVYMYLIQI